MTADAHPDLPRTTPPPSTISPPPPGETNWAGNYTYRAQRVVSPATVDELQEIVASTQRVRALGSRHCFTDIADTEGVLVSLSRLPLDVTVDEAARSATVSGGATYGVLAAELHSRGWALANLASLPHITVAGSVATGTHGSGDRNTSLSCAVNMLELVGADGEIRTVRRGDPDFDGHVIGLGALGIVTRIGLDIEPTFEVSQQAFLDLPWSALEADLDAVTSSAYSVSLFTDWMGDGMYQAWLKGRAGEPAPQLPGATPATDAVHMVRGAATESVTAQGGVSGPWHERLPHFRVGFAPSRGAELQSEYYVPRPQALAAVAAMRRLGPGLRGVLQSGEIRTLAADDLWLSGAYQQDVIGLHFTWVVDEPAVYRALEDVEAALLPLGARPHWGKCFITRAETLATCYPRLRDFAQLRARVDPNGVFDNAFLQRVLP